MASANELRNFVLQNAFELRDLMRRCYSLYMKLLALSIDSELNLINYIKCWLMHKINHTML